MTVANKAAKDDGAGNLTGPGSTINYATGSVHLKAVEDFSSNSYESAAGAWVVETATDEFEPGTTVTASYILDTATPSTAQQTLTIPPLKLNLAPLTSEPIVPFSVSFVLSGSVYIDRGGLIYKDVDPDTGAGTECGSIDYASGEVTLTDWNVRTNANNTFEILSMLTQRGDWDVYKVSFRTAGAPLKLNSFFISANKVSDGQLATATANSNGILLTADIDGLIEVDNGIATVKFGRWVTDDATAQAQPWYGKTEDDGNGNVFEPEPVIPSTVKYNAVAFSYLPIDAELIGIDAVRLPSDGRVPIYRPGDVMLIHESSIEILPGGLSADQVVNLTGGNYQLIELYDANDVQVDSALYTVDLVAGSVTMGNPLDLSAYTQPLAALKRYEDFKLISDVQVNGQITFTTPLINAYTANSTFASSALAKGDIQSRVYNLFDQQTWTNVWDNNLIGNETSAEFNDVTYPLVVTNKGAIQERWALVFTSTTAFDIIGESVGVIGSGNASTVTAPLNPETNVPYFQIPQEGWGLGWSTGNVLRFNTDASNIPVWLARTTLPGPEVEPTDKFTVQIRGDA